MIRLDKSKCPGNSFYTVVQIFRLKDNIKSLKLKVRMYKFTTNKTLSVLLLCSNACKNCTYNVPDFFYRYIERRIISHMLTYGNSNNKYRYCIKPFIGDLHLNLMKENIKNSTTNTSTVHKRSRNVEKTK